MSRDVFQGKCLVGTNGYQWMDLYDRMPKEIRLRLQSSHHNICSACLQGQFEDTRYYYLNNEMAAWHKAIDHIESQIESSLQ